MLAALVVLSGMLPAMAQTWVEVGLDGCGCTATMPGKPKITDSRRADGSPTQVALFETRALAFILSHTKFANLNRNRTPDELLMLARDAAAKGGQLLSDRSMTWLGHPAREFTWRDPKNDVSLIRLLLVGNHFYQIGVSGYGERSLSHRNVRRFIDSFTLTSPPQAPVAQPILPDLDPATIGEFAGHIEWMVQHCGGRITPSAESRFAKAKAESQAEFEHGFRAGKKRFEDIAKGMGDEAACRTAEVSFGPNGIRPGLWRR